MTDTANANPTDAPRSTAQIHAEFASAGFFRRLAAMIYDVLVAVAIIMLASALALGCAALLTSLGWLELPAGMDHAAWLNQSMFYQIYLLLVLGGFFGWFWWRSGQTIGMRAWRLKVQQRNGHRITKKQALIRVLTCCFGLGNLWVLVDFKHRRAWHDYAAGTELVTLSQEANQLYYWKEL
ncbi:MULTISPECIES: RDD family protein [Pseudidiomarina]|uniref:RDD family membrane protein YckC n=2 Tax=Pseudidiomarina TaxID=2800384 RepID=A0A368UNH6_9GAMM|nr:MULTISPECIES: RDD family protein [Pseudidiomarina]PWW10575.1 putative RDD family membrane protein YckC [Pseudidiomarina maritima]RBP88323.1 putative RDD family membrane protein YckC [Pseudidiomarina tainanensis]RCW30253.1 putative RDD family membrane protein YckC [Pseudidiomarina tainanensis]